MNCVLSICTFVGSYVATTTFISQIIGWFSTGWARTCNLPMADIVHSFRSPQHLTTTTTTTTTTTFGHCYLLLCRFHRVEKSRYVLTFSISARRFPYLHRFDFAWRFRSFSFRHRLALHWWGSSSFSLLLLLFHWVSFDIHLWRRSCYFRIISMFSRKAFGGPFLFKGNGVSPRTDASLRLAPSSTEVNSPSPITFEAGVRSIGFDVTGDPPTGGKPVGERPFPSPLGIGVAHSSIGA